ncbi:lipase family protein [Neptunicella sp. SCSIO 80796]|uniref:lipase family protein n=1 Tax=Neptunicella plasticusilytica TaxID=3117012 RepID=UPI003A4E2028
MKKLKRYQYERYAVLCKLAYPLVFDHVSLGFSEDGYAEIINRYGTIIARILWQHDKKEVVVVFRGSQSIADWLVNLCCLPRRKRFADIGYFVHLGYDHLLNQSTARQGQQTNPSYSVYQQIETVLAPLIAAGKRVSLTGHSSGGALAILVADRLERQFQGSIKRVVTFGQPSPGFRSFRRHYLLHMRTYRICCDLDIITFLPPLPGVFAHVGRSLWLHNERIYENIKPSVRLYKTLLSWLISPISYHYMHKYIRNKDFFDKR